MYTQESIEALRLRAIHAVGEYRAALAYADYCAGEGEPVKPEPPAPTWWERNQERFSMAIAALILLVWGCSSWMR